MGVTLYKSSLSFFIFLIICMSHSLDIVANAHTIRKRMESVVNMGKSGTEILRPALEQPGVEFARQPMGQFHRDIAKKTDTTKPPLEPILDEASIRKPEVGFNPEVLRHEPDPPVPETIFKETADPKISIDPWPTRARENLKEKLSAIRKKIVGLSSKESSPTTDRPPRSRDRLIFASNDNGS
ncbi:hypothetical protein PTTG_08424 [Puccinia triticina 1-1 BBBD Race 1]|uniref:Uncharacterized protein n=1 Tax=Puccinia triticina (isolate 1-1 / race 1 (BBBD)) TaxID=630390 RepID=A0A180G2P3_PUCT1|nr:hypothetical protein PTTG_08424 [Puccinia triticina 1-1 BBBD Race 1]